MRGTQENLSREKVTLLTELHRPLEEHWAVKSKFGLDAKGSDYIFKQHVTRLEDIYVHHKSLPSESHNSLLNMSPVSQLYGVNGLHTTKPGWENRLKDKEGRWIDNHQKYNVLTDGSKQQPARTREHVDPLVKSNGTLNSQRNDNNSHSSSHNNSFQPTYTIDRNTRPVSATRVPDDLEGGSHENTNNLDDVMTSRRCFDSSVDKNQLIMLGMYHLDSEQEQIYNSFVSMLSKFDSHDMKQITRDAINDAESNDLLAAFGGTGSKHMQQQRV